MAWSQMYPSVGSGDLCKATGKMADTAVGLVGSETGAFAMLRPADAGRSVSITVSTPSGPTAKGSKGVAEDDRRLLE